MSGLDQDNLLSQDADEMRRRGISEDRITFALKGAVWANKGGLDKLAEEIEREPMVPANDVADKIEEGLKIRRCGECGQEFNLLLRLEQGGCRFADLCQPCAIRSALTCLICLVRVEKNAVVAIRDALSDILVRQEEGEDEKPKQA